MATSSIDTLRVLIRKGDDGWVAQCVDFDIAAQAPDYTELRTRLELTLEAELEEAGGDLSLIGPPPAEFERIWDSCEAMPGHLEGLKPGLPELEAKLCA